MTAPLAPGTRARASGEWSLCMDASVRPNTGHCHKYRARGCRNQLKGALSTKSLKASNCVAVRPLSHGGANSLGADWTTRTLACSEGLFLQLVGWPTAPFLHVDSLPPCVAPVLVPRRRLLGTEIGAFQMIA